MDRSKIALTIIAVRTAYDEGDQVRNHPCQHKLLENQPRFSGCKANLARG